LSTAAACAGSADAAVVVGCALGGDDCAGRLLSDVQLASIPMPKATMARRRIKFMRSIFSGHTLDQNVGVERF
jgi:hypothetical protein